MRPTSGFNRHHVLFNRTTWESNKIGLALREQPSLIVPMHIDTHRKLHRAVSVVPLLDQYMLSRTSRIFEGRPNDPLRSILELTNCIERSMDQPSVTDIEHRLGELAIDAINAQIPFIEYGMMRVEE